MLEETRKWMGQVLERFYGLLQCLLYCKYFLVPMPKKIDVVGNIGDLVAKFGNAGLVGVIAASIIAYYRNRSNSGTDGGNDDQNMTISVRMRVCRHANLLYCKCERPVIKLP